MANEFVEDGTFDWSLGQDSWTNADKIRPNQYAKGVNITTRGGVAGPRPGFHQRVLEFENKQLTTAYNYQRSIQSIWEAGKFQAAIPYITPSGSYIITVVSGLIFKTNIDTFKTVLMSEDIKTNQYAARLNWSYGGSDNIVIYDYPAQNIIITGDEVRRANPNNTELGLPAPEVPIAVMGTYNQNRLAIADSGVQFTLGDAVGNRTTPDAPLTFTEVFAPSSPYVNQIFSLPVEDARYPITAMGFIQEIDTNTGIGPMFVGTAKKVYAYPTNQPRDQWTAGVFGKTILSNVGIAGQRAFVNVNSDLIFMTPEASVHAFSTARNDMRKWGNVGISREVDVYLNSREKELTQFAVLGYFDNRVYISANPYRIQALDRSERPVTDYAHGGFAVMEIDQLASFLAEGTPVWAGLWTGVNPMEIFTVDKRCFVISKDGTGPNGSNALYEIMTDETYDVVRGRKRQIRSIIYTRSYSFTGEGNNGEFVQKREGTVALHLQNLGGDVKLLIERKPSHSMAWEKYAEWNQYCPITSCKLPQGRFINGLAAHEYKQFVFGDPVQTGCSPLNGDDYSIFRTIQYRITIEGETWMLENFKVRAQIVAFDERQDESLCEEKEPVYVPAECEPDWLIPEETLCQPLS